MVTTFKTIADSQADLEKDEKDLLPPKIFQSVVIIDYRSGKMRITKSHPKTLKSFEIPIKLILEVTAPKIPEIVARGKLQIDPVKVREMFIESL